MNKINLKNILKKTFKKKNKKTPKKNKLITNKKSFKKKEKKKNLKIKTKKVIKKKEKSFKENKVVDKNSNNQSNFKVSRNFKGLILNGEPIDEPIVAQGPFVMNTIEEIYQAFSDYQNGKMGSL